MSLPQFSKMYFHTSGHVTDAFSGYNRPSGKWLMLDPPPNSMPSTPNTPNTPITPYTPNTPITPYTPNTTYSPYAPSLPGIGLPNAPTAESVYGSQNYGYDGYEESQYPQQHY